MFVTLSVQAKLNHVVLPFLVLLPPVGVNPKLNVQLERRSFLTLHKVLQDHPAIEAGSGEGLVSRTKSPISSSFALFILDSTVLVLSSSMMLDIHFESAQ